MEIFQNGMFPSSKFKGDISGWDVRKVINMNNFETPLNI